MASARRVVLSDRSGFNRWAAEGDAETFTKRINGGKNRLPDRFDQLARISLVLLGKRADNVLQFKWISASTSM
nr:hypothetical protein [Ensifer sp. ENS01]